MAGGTDASGDTVYLAGNLSALGLGPSDWANGIPMTRANAITWTTTVEGAADTTLSDKCDLGGVAGATWRRWPVAVRSPTAAWP